MNRQSDNAVFAPILGILGVLVFFALSASPYMDVLIKISGVMAIGLVLAMANHIVLTLVCFGLFMAYTVYTVVSSLRTGK